jgi:Pvc16 N-terminal domain
VIQLVDRAIEQFLRESVPLPESSVDVSFDAPDRTWGAAITRPTVNIFLWEVTRNPSLGQSGLLQRRLPDGRVERRPTNPVVDLHYLITAWAAEQRDEHQLLGAILTCVLAHSVLPTSALPEQLSDTSWITMGLATHEKRAPGEFWSALDGRLKPGLELELSLPLDVFRWTPAATAADSVGVQFAPMPDRTTPAPDLQPQLRRRRVNGSLVMEGRPAEPQGADPAD